MNDFGLERTDGVIPQLAVTILGVVRKKVSKNLQPLKVMLDLPNAFFSIAVSYL